MSAPLLCRRASLRVRATPTMTTTTMMMMRMRIRRPVLVVRPVFAPTRAPATGAPAPAVRYYSGSAVADEAERVQAEGGDGVPAGEKAARREAEGEEQGEGPALETPEYLDASERHVFEKLVRELRPSRLEVQDVSGGCGSMYAIVIASRSFRGLSPVKQHRLVNQVLAEEIKGWHGVQLRTQAE